MSATTQDKFAFNGVDEAAAAFSLRPWHVRQLIQQHLLPTRRAGSRTIILADDMRRAVEAGLPSQHPRQRKEVSNA